MERSRARGSAQRVCRASTRGSFARILAGAELASEVRAASGARVLEIDLERTAASADEAERIAVADFARIPGVDPGTVTAIVHPEPL